MKTRWGLLGLCCLATALVASSMNMVHAEAESGSAEKIEAVKKEEGSKAEESTEVQETSQETTIEKQEGTVTSSSKVQQEEIVESEVGTEVESKLKIWDVVYDKEKDQITGKTEPNADIQIIHVSTENSNGGVLRADSQGNFIYPNPAAGLIRLVAHINGRESDPYEIEVKSLEAALSFVYLNYNASTKTIYGQTAPYVSVYMSIPSTGVQKAVAADMYGYFSITDQFTPGLEIILTAQDVAGNKGKPFTYHIPSQAMTDLLKIRDVNYDHTAKRLTGKTAPNATVGAMIRGGGQGIYQADAEGNFVINDTFKAGSVVVLSASLDGIDGELFEYTIPEVPVNQTIELGTETKPAGKGELPKAGAEANIVLSSIGGLTVIGTAYLMIRRKFTINR